MHVQSICCIVVFVALYAFLISFFHIIFVYDVIFLYPSFFVSFRYFLIKATPDMAVTLLEIARIFATKVPGKIDADVLQLLWKVSFHLILAFDEILFYCFKFLVLVILLMVASLILNYMKSIFLVLFIRD